MNKFNLNKKHEYLYEKHFPLQQMQQKMKW